MELLYRGTRDGCKCDIFHNKCDNKCPTIVLCKNEKNNIFGGYLSISWTSKVGYHNANGSFIFTLTNIYNTVPTKFPMKQDLQEYTVFHNGNTRGRVFEGGMDISIVNDYLNNNDSF